MNLLINPQGLTTVKKTKLNYIENHYNIVKYAVHISLQVFCCRTTVATQIMETHDRSKCTYVGYKSLIIDHRVKKINCNFQKLKVVNSFNNC